MSKLVSIILPVRNGEVYLGEAIQSILNQTYENFELIVIDDFSNDSTESICAEFVERDHRVRLIKNSVNLGLPSSLNVGFSHAKGELLTWTSHDNNLCQNFLSTLVSRIDSGFDFVYSDYFVIDSSGLKIGVSEVSQAKNLIYGNCIGASFMYTREVYEVLGNFAPDSFMYEDYEYWTRVWISGFKMLAISIPLYEYRRHDLQLTVTRPMPESYLDFRMTIIDQAKSVSRKERSKATVQLIPLFLRSRRKIEIIRLLKRSIALNPLATVTESKVIVLDKIRNTATNE